MTVALLPEVERPDGPKQQQHRPRNKHHGSDLEQPRGAGGLPRHRGVSLRAGSAEIRVRSPRSAHSPCVSWSLAHAHQAEVRGCHPTHASGHPPSTPRAHRSDPQFGVHRHSKLHSPGGCRTRHLRAPPERWALCRSSRSRSWQRLQDGDPGGLGARPGLCPAAPHDVQDLSTRRTHKHTHSRASPRQPRRPLPAQGLTSLLASFFSPSQSSPGSSPH